MDLVKKRKLDENGSILDPTLTLTESDARSILEPITTEQLRDILTTAILTHPAILASVRDVADRDIARRKLFVRGLGSETTSESLRSVFSAFGELEEAVVISDKGTGKSKGYGFVTYRHVDSAVLALKEPSKNIDGRISVAALASAGAASGGRTADTMLRKIFVGNVAYDMSAERLLEVFSSFGEIEEGPVGFDKLTGKSKGYALIVYKMVDGAKTALSEPLKLVDGRQLVCRLASEGKKGKLGGDAAPPPSGPYSASGGPGGGEGGYPPYSGFNGMGQQTNNQMNPSYNSSVGGQGPGGFGGNPGYGSGGGYGGEPHYGGRPNPSSYGGYGGGPNSGGYGGGPNSSGYGGGQNSSGYGGGPNSSGYGGGPNPSGHGGYGGSGSGAAGNGGAGRDGYGMQPNSGGPPSGGRYSDSAHYSLSAGGYSSQQHQPTGTSPAPRIPPGGAGGYPPPYY